MKRFLEFARSLFSSSPAAQRSAPEIQWMITDQNEALELGWGLFEGSNGLELQRYDDAKVFKSDLQAWEHVWMMAEHGDRLCAKALNVLQQGGQEYELIARSLDRGLIAA